MAKVPLTDTFFEPLNGAAAARVNISAGDSNLSIDRLSSSDQALASGSLQYFEDAGQPTRTLDSSSGQTAFTVTGRANLRPKFRFPWSACNGLTEWQIHLNPAVSSDITAISGGGNVKLDLDGMDITRVSADTGGGNMDLVLPDNTQDISVTAHSGAGNVTVEMGDGITGESIVNAKSGAGNVTVHIPRGIAARIFATTGMGKVIIGSQFNQVGDHTYQSSDFDSAANKIDITAKSGAGNVSIDAN
ncbi:MAG TPA: LiaF domain-containing protein, partial [Anaerolineales bacterium]